MVYRSNAIAQRYVRSPSYERTRIRKPHLDHTFIPGSYLPGLFFARIKVALIRCQPVPAYLFERFQTLAIER